MAYFSRLTDIVTCNLTSILEQAADPARALEEIIHEMQEGVSGAERSVKTSTGIVSQLEREIGEQRAEASSWIGRAQQALQGGDEVGARQSLERKHEIEDLIAGLEQQLQAAMSTRDHLQTMLNALHARLADARRRLQDLSEGNQSTTERTQPVGAATAKTPTETTRKDRVDAELEELRKQLSGG